MICCSYCRPTFSCIQTSQIAQPYQFVALFTSCREEVCIIVVGNKSDLVDKREVRKITSLHERTWQQFCAFQLNTDIDNV